MLWTVVPEKTLGSPLDHKEIKPVNPKGNKSWIFIGRKLQYFGHLMGRTESLEKLEKCWERLKVGGERDDRGWDGWMASLSRWTWVWASSRSWWWTGRPGVLQSMRLQRVSHNWATELIQYWFFCDWINFTYNVFKVHPGCSLCQNFLSC